MRPTHYHELVELLHKAESIEEVHAVCARLTQELGFDFFLYGARFPTSFVKPTSVIISGYPEVWNPWYRERQYERIDPIIRHCAQHITPLSWDSLHKADGDESARVFMSEARDLGLRCGVSFPLHGSYGEKILFSLAAGSEGRAARRAVENARPFVPSLLAHIHETIRHLLDDPAVVAPEIQLSLREKECLLWSAEGKTAWEISQILHISERTVVFHLQNAADKLGVINRQQAVARAISLGIITPQPA